MSAGHSPTAFVRRAREAPRQAAAFARLSPVARAMLRERLTYLSPVKLRRLEEAVREVDAAGVPGAIAEFGVALGGVSIALASASPERALHGFDVFGMIPAPTERDGEHAQQRFEVIESGHSRGIRGGEYYGYMDDVLGAVRASFARHGVDADGGRVSLHQGLFEETWPRLADEIGPLALVHVDCDWHDPVAFVLEAVAPHVSPAGVIVVDDYVTYEGARDATDAFMAAHPEFERRHLDESLSLRRHP
ncbi:TylF/MycF/NovP-related O-methyltransferase [Demequina sp. NBRC 110056]|uniref:TylF/MycF/NovP-related O-methyltransferase n=1 Tax=Demequina sp. NBRC 110056 TaxID=1570345 RepID=UPI0009FDAB51|nr:TylF/MycF/NovP-related O-methyltransferase [Demequina sp. NBRC 110056]